MALSTAILRVITCRFSNHHTSHAVNAGCRLRAQILQIYFAQSRSFKWIYILIPYCYRPVIVISVDLFHPYSLKYTFLRIKGYLYFLYLSYMFIWNPSHFKITCTLKRIVLFLVCDNSTHFYHASQDNKFFAECLSFFT